MKLLFSYSRLISGGTADSEMFGGLLILFPKLGHSR